MVWLRRWSNTYKYSPPPQPPTPTTKVLFDDNYMTATNAQLTAEWWQSIWQTYWLTTWSNWLHWVTFVTDTHSWVEFPLTDDLVWGKLYREIEWYSWTFQRRWNIWFSLDRPVYAANASNKYNVGSGNAWWWMWLWSLPWFDNS